MVLDSGCFISQGPGVKMTWMGMSITGHGGRVSLFNPQCYKQLRCLSLKDDITLPDLHTPHLYPQAHHTKSMGSHLSIPCRSRLPGLHHTVDFAWNPLLSLMSLAYTASLFKAELKYYLVSGVFRLFFVQWESPATSLGLFAGLTQV